MGGVVALIVLAALLVFALSRLLRSWRTTNHVWGEGDRGGGEGEGS